MGGSVVVVVGTPLVVGPPVVEVCAPAAEASAMDVAPTVRTVPPEAEALQEAPAGGPGLVVGSEDGRTEVVVDRAHRFAMLIVHLDGEAAESFPVHAERSLGGSAAGAAQL